jgi:predicted ABC-type sugar transport system permease subunit
MRCAPHNWPKDDRAWSRQCSSEVGGPGIGARIAQRNSLTLLGISTFWQGTFVGSFIVIAVLFDRLRSRGANE